ncbi:hypothetical protein VULLAG_LOCUS1622 [Vulpes lagopus]
MMTYEDVELTHWLRFAETDRKWKLTEVDLLLGPYTSPMMEHNPPVALQVQNFPFITSLFTPPSFEAGPPHLLPASTKG